MDEIDTDYTPKVKEIAERLGFSAMDLVRHCDISIATSYGLLKDHKYRMDVYWKVYAGLRNAGYKIKFRDVVDWDE